jgi:gliding motility-associated-like protein
MSIVIRDNPSAGYTVSDECAEDDVFFTNTSSSTGAGALTGFDWDFGDGDSSSVQSPSHSYSSGGQYNTRLIVTASNGCKDTATRTVTVHPLPTADFSYNGVCLSNAIRVQYEDLSSGNGDSITSWSWSLGDGTNAIIQDPSHLYPNTDDRVVSLEVTTDEGCTDMVSDSVILQDPPLAGFGVEAAENKIGAVISLIDSSERTVSWEWTFGDGSIPSNDPEPEHIYSEPGNYRIVQIVRNEIGCPDTAVRTIKIDGELPEIPNAISPNGDGKNDVWKLRFLEIYPEAVVVIRDRWGKEVFRSQGYSEPWDGKMNGEPLPEGTYYYVIELPEREDLTGPVLLIR